MSLPDFLEFEPFNELRRKMGADQLGYFELFDPKYHLTGGERSELERVGLTVPHAHLHQLLDFTLVYKNSRVIAIAERCFHLCHCNAFTVDTQYRISTSLRIIADGTKVCRDCLQKLQYKGYDAKKARREAYSEQVFAQFSLVQFWRQYPLYPVSEKRELRKELGK